MYIRFKWILTGCFWLLQFALVTLFPALFETKPFSVFNVSKELFFWMNNTRQCTLMCMCFQVPLVWKSPVFENQIIIRTNSKCRPWWHSSVRNDIPGFKMVLGNWKCQFLVFLPNLHGLNELYSTLSGCKINGMETGALTLNIPPAELKWINLNLHYMW